MMGKFVKRRPLTEEMSLQITSMADIFMILLVFLLKNYSTNLSNLSPSVATKLPVASSDNSIKDTLKLEISSHSILIDQKPVVSLSRFDFKPWDIQQNGFCDKLYHALFEERKRQPPNMDPNLLVLADEKTPYSTLKTVLASVASAGFVDLQLVVVQQD